MSAFLAIGAGGALGAVARYWLSGRVSNWMGSEFPWGTLSVNVIGSFLIGLLALMLNTKTPMGEHLRLGLLVGVLGGFTTFSAFSGETLRLLETAQWFKAIVYISASVLLCILAAAAGMAAGRQLS